MKKKILKIKKVEKFNESLIKNLNSMQNALEKKDKKVVSGPRIRINKNIILMKISDTNEVVELINPLILAEKDDLENLGQKIIAICYNSRDGKLENAILTKEDSKLFSEEYNFIQEKNK